MAPPPPPYGWSRRHSSIALMAFFGETAPPERFLTPRSPPLRRGGSRGASLASDWRLGSSPVYGGGGPAEPVEGARRWGSAPLPDGVSVAGRAVGLFFVQNGDIAIGREPHLVAFDFGDEVAGDEMVMPLMAPAAALAGQRLSSAALKAFLALKAPPELPVWAMPKPPAKSARPRPCRPPRYARHRPR